MILDISTSSFEASQQVAQLIIDRINAFSPTMHRKFVLGLPARESFIEVYRFLAKFCRAQQVSFEFVVVVIIDEYAGIGAENHLSHAHFMEREFFSQVDLPPGQIHLLNGAIRDPEMQCAVFESRIIALGGIHLLIVDLGQLGQLGWNQPGLSLSSRTRVVSLSKSVQDQTEENHQPSHGLTMGLGTILESNEIIVLATGSHLAEAVQACFGGGISHLHPASILQLHPEVITYCDVSAASLLDVEVRRILSPTPKLEVSPTDTLPSLPSPSISTPSDAFSLTLPLGLGIPLTTLPSPTLEPIPESLEHPKTPLLSLTNVGSTGGGVSVSELNNALGSTGDGRPVKILKRRPGLRWITTALPVTQTRPMNQLGENNVQALNSRLIKVQEGEQDDAGPGW